MLLFALFSVGTAQAGLVEFCAQTQKELKENKLTMREALRDSLTVTYRPSVYGTPVRILGESTLDNQKKGSENLILTIDSLMKNEDPKAFAQEKKHFKELNKKIKHLFRQVRQATKPHKTAEECARELEKKEFKLDHFFALQTEQNRLFDTKIAREAKALKKVLPKHFLKNEWRVHTQTHLLDLISFLRSPKPTNIVFITHATNLGQLLDSSGNIIPKNFFETVSGSLNTLAIYSCHSEKVKEFYSLDKLKNISVFMAKESEYLNQKEVAPLAAAGNFIRQIDRAVYTQVQKNFTLPVREICQLDISGIQAQKTDFGVFHQTTLIGVVKKDENAASIDFDCTNWDNKKSVIGLRSMSLLTSSGEMEIKEGKIEFKRRFEITRLQLTLVQSQQGELQVIKAKMP